MKLTTFLITMTISVQSIQFNNFVARMYYRFYFSKVHDGIYLPIDNK